MLIKKTIYTLILIIIFQSCSNEKKINMSKDMDYAKNIPQKKWDSLSQKKIYFGHQSVGYNIIDGLENHLKKNPGIKLEIKEGTNLELFDHSVFAHSQNGQNTNPKSKIDAFYNTLNNGIGNKVDMAGFKFCYIDFDKNTNVEELFEYYKQKMDEIKIKYPNLKVIHFTVPLHSIQHGPKAFIKKIIGKSIGIDENISRNQFNNLLLSEFSNQPVFDLAKSESTYRDGRREYTIVNNEKIYSLIDDYTNDGGHLSENGKDHVAAQFLSFLVEESN